MVHIRSQPVTRSLASIGYLADQDGHPLALCTKAQRCHCVPWTRRRLPQSLPTPRGGGALSPSSWPAIPGQTFPLPPWSPLVCPQTLSPTSSSTSPRSLRVPPKTTSPHSCLNGRPPLPWAVLPTVPAGTELPTLRAQPTHRPAPHWAPSSLIWVDTEIARFSDAFVCVSLWLGHSSQVTSTSCISLFLFLLPASES